MRHGCFYGCFLLMMSIQGRLVKAGFAGECQGWFMKGQLPETGCPHAGPETKGEKGKKAGRLRSEVSGLAIWLTSLASYTWY